MSPLRTVSSLLSIALILPALAGCATPGDPKPPVCDGRHRRPANPYGSILSVVLTPKTDAHQVRPATPGAETSEHTDAGGCA